MKQIRLFKADFFRTLSNPIRIAILDCLREGEMKVNDLATSVGADQAYISQQLSVLKSRNMVKFRKEGNFVYYSITDHDIFTLLDDALRIAKKQLSVFQESIDK